MDITIQKTLKSYLTIVIVSGALYILFLAHKVLLYLAIATFIALAVSPLVRLIERRKLGRGAAALLSLLAILIVVLLISATIATPLVLQGRYFIENLPTLTQSLVHNPTVSGLTEKYNIAGRLMELSSNASAIVLGSGSSLYLFFNSVLGFFTSLSIVLVMAFFLLLEGPGFWTMFVDSLKPEYRTRAKTIGTNIRRAVSGFVSGNLLISLIAGSVTLIAALMLGVPYAFALAALVALFDLIPLVGTAIATVVVGLVALTQSLHAALIIVAILLAYQFIEGHVIQPAIYSRSIQLSPLIIIVATVAGADLGGIIGILLAIPLASIIQIVVLDIRSSRSVHTHTVV